jgi:formiminotetrahydrofolate cyclodeaminase
MEKTVAAMELLPVIAEKGNENSISDIGVANLMANSALRGAHLNVRINIPGLADEKKKTELSDKAADLLKKAESLFGRTEKIVESKLQ